MPSRRGPFLFLRLCLFLLTIAGLRSSAWADDTTAYQQHIKPLLAARCIACHGVLKQEAGLRLDTGQLARKGSEGGPVLIAGDPKASAIVQRVAATDAAQRMPPEGEPLTPAQIQQLTDWIQTGALSPADEQPERDPREHWAFQMVERPPLPTPANGWGRNPLDGFIAAGHVAQGLQAAAPANRLELIRRLYIDLLGLPPTIDDWKAAEQDTRDGWYQRLVDRLLDDPRYGQRWGRHWMDIWRYSDWWGLGDQLRNSQMHMWHWRDWIVDSLNADMPYDQMVRLMLAADELSPTDRDQLRATGYLARNYFLFNRHQWMDETVEHVSKGLLGLTMNCAKCHDHKYDPIAQADYYRLRAFFEPYHVRLDMLPGELDFSRDGLPRVYESQAESPTYLFVRGQETQPDKSKVLTPGLPDIVAFDDLRIQPLELPAVAWQPERQDFVKAAYNQAADRKIEAAASALVKAQQRWNELRKKVDAPAQNSTNEGAQPLFEPIRDSFATLDREKWQVLSGQWVHDQGKLKQTQDGPTRSVLRLVKPPPTDFEAVLKFTIHGGSMWRSMCLDFDAVENDPSQPAAGDSQQTVYVSAYEGGSKLQAAVTRQGKSEYPADGAVARPIALDKEYTLKVLVRGKLINAWLNDELLVAWSSSLERRTGHLQLTTFDALVSLHGFELRALPPDVVLNSGGKSKDPAKELASAESAAGFAQRDLEIARQEKELVELQFAAWRLHWQWQDAVDLAEPARQSLHQQAIEAHHRALAFARQLDVTRAQRVLDGHEFELKDQSGAKRVATEKQVKAARESLEKAQKTLAEQLKPTDTAPAIVAAKWTATRFLNSGADDPQVALGPKSSGRRTALANWITDRRNPLTARVAVNHIWTRHFGQSLVDPAFDFGRKTPEPRHRLLLDWLAAEFMESGWSIKHLHRLICNSETYRLSSSIAERSENVSKDPDNHWLWRRPAIRIESQVVRDGILALAGTLDTSLGGPPIMPGEQAASRRRSLYFFHSNNERNLFLTTFDEAAVKECYRREQSIVPQQALALTNSQLVLDASKSIAESLARQLPPDRATDDGQFVDSAFRVILGIVPGEAERAASLEAMAQWRKLGDNQNRGPQELLAWALLNHNDFVTLR